MAVAAGKMYTFINARKHWAFVAGARGAVMRVEWTQKTGVKKEW